ncbi:pimeloyl-ACP methyl ester carboxylesterase [Kibdelosporangium phytohabitans]|nr:alpha/beta hydrolase [Kibdelosporangium phytohabitans]MBE1461430.1 pimeloyl-ACP methyl ester carboxylesterase [Kibdelosporangium phytohabitans]
MAVPLDYRAPTRRTIEIEVSRIPAAKREQRKGVLFLNGGGPSASLDVPTAIGSFLPAEVRDSYDLVAFDPRGIGHSTPMDCGRDIDELIRTQQLGVLSFPRANGSIGDNVAYAQQMAKHCAARSGELLPHLTTANIARDMDRIRTALGERTVSYYGVSWGTYLGAIYRELFPRTVDRMVIDSSVDPAKRGYDDFRTFSAAMEDRWPDLARFAVANNDTVRLGSTERAIRQNYLALTAKLDRHPVELPGTTAPINGNLVRLYTWQLSYSDASMRSTPGSPAPMMAQLWRAAANVAAGNATEADRAFLVGLTTDFVTKGVLKGVPHDNLFSVGWAISCADKAWPRHTLTYALNTLVDRARFPLTAGAPANIAPCAAWKVAPTGPEPTIEPTGKRNVLILQNLRDPATPLRTAQGMRRAMGADASLVTVDAGGHGVLVHPEPSRCAIDTLKSFLTVGALPREDKSCP